MALVWFNGNFVDESVATVSIRDGGLLHAAGVFTTLRAMRGGVFRLTQHLRRLGDSCQALGIPRAYSDETLSMAIDELLKKNDLRDARMRLTVTAGAMTENPVSNCFLTAAPLQLYPEELYEKGMTVALLDEQKLNPWDIQAGHKTLNYFSRMAALRWARQQGAGEAIWFNIFNYLQSGSISNIFLVKEGKLITPPTQGEMEADKDLRERLPYGRSNVLPGVTRGAVLELAGSQDLPVELGAINVEQLLDADEVFLTNSIMGVMPVNRIERSIVGGDRPGEITRRISEAFRDIQN